MKSSFFKIILLIFFIPTFLFSIEIKPLKGTNLIETQDDKSIDEKLNKQEEIALEVIKNINDEIYKDGFDEKNYDKKINYLLNRININQRQNNKSAVKRDEIKLLLLQNKRMFENTLIDIIYAKESFKDKKFFINILSNNIQLLEKNSYSKYKDFYTDELTKENKISKEFVKNYEKLEEENDQQLFTLKYLLENISLYRKTNFFIDEFNLQYIVKQIDSLPIISPISQFSSYHFKFSIGEIILVLLIMVFFRLLNTKIITILTTFLNKIFTKNSNKNSEDNDDSNEEFINQLYIKESIEKPLIFALYLLSIHISIYILIKDTELINEIVPWINTVYMGLFTWGVYSLLSNSISNFAQHLISKYPNVRKEMIVFILRILKITLILLVVLFLFAQLGIDIKAIAASVGVGGIAIALASKDTLANFFGSLNIMTDNSFSQGDWIVANEVEGTVVDIRMRTTRIRTFDNAMITIPNSELANTHIKNYSKRRIGRRIKMKLSITYESAMNDIVNLKNEIYEMLDNHEDIASETNVISSRSKKFEAIKREDLQGVKRTLLVFIDEYDHSSINILVYCFARSPKWEDWLGVKEDVLIKINELVKKNNCEFAYPSQTLFLKK
ncbi:MAG: hypothetical protein C0625_04345 [Arcobacter sp.]|nr:MAG: hypothetical protein C0625_04345 [Arcobacter sp.]